ncbi:MAG: gluconeogenesis factor YvcK family protein [Candidatus Gracilibacteria bacterium]
MKKTNITVIGGGAGSFNVLYGLKKVFSREERDLRAIIAMTDSGGTTGEIRDKYGVLPPGDIRRAVAALARDTGFVRKLFEYRFSQEYGVIGGNKIGNILLTALADIKGSFESGLDEACKMFDTEGQVIPVTLEDVHLGVKFEDGTEIIGEKNIDVSDKNDFERTHNTNQNIIDAFLVGGIGNLNPRARESILTSDIIIIGPGDFYTSIIPNLLSPGMKEALKETKAKIIYVCNIMTKKGETTTYELPDFIDNIEKYAGEVIDYVIVNNGNISDELVEKYKKEEGKKPVKMKETHNFLNKKYKIINEDMIDESDVVRHDPEKLARVIREIALS